MAKMINTPDPNRSDPAIKPSEVYYRDGGREGASTRRRLTAPPSRKAVGSPYYSEPRKAIDKFGRPPKAVARARRVLDETVVDVVEDQILNVEDAPEQFSEPAVENLLKDADPVVKAHSLAEEYKLEPLTGEAIRLDLLATAETAETCSKAINLAREGNLVQIQTRVPGIVEAAMQQIALKHKLSEEHLKRIKIEKTDFRQNEKFNPNQVAVGNVDEDVRKSVDSGHSAVPLNGLE